MKGISGEKGAPGWIDSVCLVIFASRCQLERFLQKMNVQMHSSVIAVLNSASNHHKFVGVDVIICSVLIKIMNMWMF